MLVKEFIEKLKNGTKGTASIGEGLTINKYLPFAQKRVLIDKIKKACIETVDGIAVADYMLLNAMIDIYAVSAYIGLEFDDDYIEGYDALMESGILERIIEVIGDDYYRFADAAYDEIQNCLDIKNDLRNIIGKKINEATVNLVDTLGALDSKDLKSIGDLLKGFMTRADV